MCRSWDLPDLVEGILDRTYLDIVPPSLRPPGHPGWRRARSRSVRLAAIPGPASACRTPSMPSRTPTRPPDPRDALPHRARTCSGPRWRGFPTCRSTSWSRPCPAPILTGRAAAAPRAGGGAHPPRAPAAALPPGGLAGRRRRHARRPRRRLPQLILPQGADQPAQRGGLPGRRGRARPRPRGGHVGGGRARVGRAPAGGARVHERRAPDPRRDRGDARRRPPSR